MLVDKKERKIFKRVLFIYFEMNKKIILLISLMLLVGLVVFVSALSEIKPQQSKSLNSGNGICEHYQKEFSIGEKDLITINGATLNIEYLGDKNWKVNDYEGKLQNHDFFTSNQNPNLKGVRFDFSFMDQHQPGCNFGLTEEDYYPWDCQGYSRATGLVSEIKIKDGWNLVPLDISLIDCGYALNGELCKDDVLVSYIYLPALKKYFTEEELEELEKEYRTNPDLKNNADLRDCFSEENEFALQKSSKWIYVKPGVGNKKIIRKFGEVQYRNQFLNNGAFRLNKGWNFLFVDAFMVYDDDWNENPLSLEDMKGNCTFQSAYLWDAQNQQWKAIANLGDKNILKNGGGVGAGFIVKIANDCSLGYNGGETATPPVLPN